MTNFQYYSTLFSRPNHLMYGLETFYESTILWHIIANHTRLFMRLARILFFSTLSATQPKMHDVQMQ